MLNIILISTISYRAPYPLALPMCSPGSVHTTVHMVTRRRAHWTRVTRARPRRRDACAPPPPI